MKFFNFFLFLFFSVLLSTSAYAQATRFMQNDIRQLKTDVELLQRSLYRSADSTQTNSGDVQIKMGEMETLFATTSGKIEEFEHRLKTLEDKVDMINKDMDLRFSMLEEKVNVNNFEHKKDVVVAPENAKIDEKITGSVEDMYKNGLDALNNGQRDKAINIFTTLIKNNPKHQLAANAQYWLGESYYGSKDFERAAIAFAKGYSEYKTSPKAVDSLLKLGMSMIELKKKDDACLAFMNLPKEFPNALENLKNKAKEQAKKHSCK